MGDLSGRVVFGQRHVWETLPDTLVPGWFVWLHRGQLACFVTVAVLLTVTLGVLVLGAPDWVVIPTVAVTCAAKAMPLVATVWLGRARPLTPPGQQ